MADVHEQNYELLRYYSSRVFQARVSGITAYALIWFAIFRFAGSPPAGTAYPLILGTPPATFLAFGGVIFVALLFMMENGYYSKYLTVLQCLKRREYRECPDDAARQECFATHYKQLSHLAVHLFHLLSVGVLAAYAVSRTFSPFLIVACFFTILGLLTSTVWIEIKIFVLRNEIQ